MSNNTNIKRKGPAEVISKSGDCLWVCIRLSAIPNLDWQQCFKELPAFQLNKAYSKGLRFNGDNSFDIQSTMRGLESNIKWIDKFIEQANASYKNKIAEKIAEKKSQEELEALRKEEIRKINESIKRI